MYIFPPLADARGVLAAPARVRFQGPGVIQGYLAHKKTPTPLGPP